MCEKFKGQLTGSQQNKLPVSFKAMKSNVAEIIMCQMIDKFYWQYKKKLFKNHTNKLEV